MVAGAIRLVLQNQRSSLLNEVAASYRVSFGWIEPTITEAYVVPARPDFELHVRQPRCMLTTPGSSIRINAHAPTCSAIRRKH